MADKNTKKLTILHSNDLHGDFLAEHVDEKKTGNYKDFASELKEEGSKKQSDFTRKSRGKKR